MLEVPTVLPGPTSCHLADMKLVTRPPLYFCGKYQQCCQGQHLVICKISNFWQEARASNVSPGRHQTCGRVLPGPATCHLLVQFVFSICDVCIWYFRHQSCGRTSTFIMLEVHSVARANILSSGWKTPKLWQGQHFYLVESINSVAKASRSTNSASRASILSSGRHQSCGRASRASRASTFIMFEVPKVLPGPRSCHLADMKLVTRPPLYFCGKYQQCCQGQHLVI